MPDTTSIGYNLANSGVTLNSTLSTLKEVATALGAAILVLIIPLSAARCWGDDADAFAKLNAELLGLRDELTNDTSSRVDEFITRATLVGYAPADYIRVVRNDEKGRDGNSVLDGAAVRATEGGIWNASLLTPTLVARMDINSSKLQALLLSAAELVEQYRIDSTWDVAVRRDHIRELLAIDEQLRLKMLREDLFFAAQNGSPLANLLLLHKSEGNRTLTDMSCGFIALAGFSGRNNACPELDSMPSMQHSHLKNGSQVRLAKLEAEFGESAKFYKSVLCNNLNHKASNEAVCADLMASARDVCVIRTVNVRYRAVDGLPVCSGAALRVVRTATERAYINFFGMAIYD